MWYNDEMARAFLHLVPALALGLLLPIIAASQEIDPCPFAVLPCATGGAEGVTSYFADQIFPAIRIFFIAATLLHFFYYGFQMLYESNNEEATKTAKGGYEQALYGCGYMALASLLVDTFGSSARETLINPEPLQTAFGNIILFFKIAISAVITFLVVVIALRLATVQDEGERDKAKKRLMSMFLGVAFLLLANVMVEGFAPGSNSGIITAEMRGAANFLLTIFGALCVFWFVGAGIIMVLSTSEEQSGKAKQAVTTAVMAIAVVLCSYLLVNYFLSL
jgi:hypothetical protein